MTPVPHDDIAPSQPLPAAGAGSAARLRRWQGPLCFLILTALAVLPYVNSLRNGFVYDDFDQVLANPYIHDFHHLRQIFTSSVWSFKGDFRATANYYRPVMSVGYLLCYQLFGPRAVGFHLANLLANVGVVLLVFVVTRRMFRSRAVALAAAGIFALHPVHTEAVDWIAAVTELELALFYLLAFGFFHASARPGGKSSIPLQIAMAGSFALALLSKEQAMTLPLLAALFEHLFREEHAETTQVQKFRRYGCLWVIAIIYLMLRIRYLGRLAPSVDRPGLGLGALIISGLALIGQYGWKLVWPAELCAYYTFPSDLASLCPRAVGGLAVLVICALAFAVLWRSNRSASFGVVWFLATLAPVWNVRWMASNPFAERYLYLASVGFCWAVGWAALQGWKSLSAVGSRWRFALPVAVCLLAALAVFRIVTRNPDWRDNITFYRATLVISPSAYYMHNNLGVEYWEGGNRPAAEKEFREALRLAPTSEYALHNLALVAMGKRSYSEAENLLLRALAVQPNYSDAHLELGRTYDALGRFQEAEAQMRAAEYLSPLSVRVHTVLSEFYFDRRRLDQAEAEARRSLEVQPTTQGYWDLGLAEWLKGDRAGAERAFLGAETLNPTDSRSHFMLGLFYGDSDRPADAIREYRAGLKLDPTNTDALAHLMKLEAESGEH